MSDSFGFSTVEGMWDPVARTQVVELFATEDNLERVQLQIQPDLTEDASGFSTAHTGARAFAPGRDASRRQATG